MAVVPLEKVLVVVHKSIREEFLPRLQRAGLLHVSEVSGTAPGNPRDLERINQAIQQVGAYRKKQLLETFVNLRTAVKPDVFDEEKNAAAYRATIDELEAIRKEREALSNRQRIAAENVTRLTPWKNVPYCFERMRQLQMTTVVFAVLPQGVNAAMLEERLAGLPVSVEEVGETDGRKHCLCFALNSDVAAVRAGLLESGVELTDMPETSGTVAEHLAAEQREGSEAARGLEDLRTREERLLAERTNLLIASDRLLTDWQRQALESSLPATETTFQLVGWVKRKDRGRLETLVKESGLAVMELLTPEPDEAPPVAIENRRWSAPYEMLLRLYSMPNHREFDPTGWIAVSFPLFFALCLTDAIYGIFLALFSLYLMRKVPGDKSLLWILFGGGILTIFTGSMVGGWAGNLFDLLGIPFLVAFKNRFMLFDPLVTPMPFFYLSLAIGYVHTLIGIMIEVYDDMRNRAFAVAVFENLTWFFIINGLVLNLFVKAAVLHWILGCLTIMSMSAILVFSNRAGTPRLVDQVLWYVVMTLLVGTALSGYFKFALSGLASGALALAVVGLIRFRQAKIVLSRVVWGLYNLYGISGFLSNILSYVRLMALGMVTGGIAMTVNQIAWMVIKIPVAGIVLAVLILVGGHLFNLVINSLGGFIHTLRLHYIEFFGRFYTGGGKAFKPFRMDTRYVEIE